VSMPSSHIFVSLTDLKKIEVDAWLVPGSSWADEDVDQTTLFHGISWLGMIKHLRPQLRFEPVMEADGTPLIDELRWPHNPHAGHPRVARVVGAPPTNPVPLVTKIGFIDSSFLVKNFTQAEILQWVSEGVRQFIFAAAALPGAPRHGRSRKLIAMPIVATGLGGWASDDWSNY